MIEAFLGGVIYSRFSVKFGGEPFTWTESLINGLIGTVCTETSYFLTERITPTNRGAGVCKLRNRCC